MTKKFFALATASLFLVACGPINQDDEEFEEKMEKIEEMTIDELEQAGLAEEVPGPEEEAEFLDDEFVIGSCSVIEESSTCIDYIGSFWNSQVLELGCSGEGMVPSKEPCPGASVGGCRIGADTESEMITWFYDFGGEPIGGEDVQYSEAACNATLGAHWVGAK